MWQDWVGAQPSNKRPSNISLNAQLPSKESSHCANPLWSHFSLENSPATWGGMGLRTPRLGSPSPPSPAFSLTLSTCVLAQLRFQVCSTSSTPQVGALPCVHLTLRGHAPAHALPLAHSLPISQNTADVPHPSSFVSLLLCPNRVVYFNFSIFIMQSSIRRKQRSTTVFKLAYTTITSNICLSWRHMRLAVLVRQLCRTEGHPGGLS